MSSIKQILLVSITALMIVLFIPTSTVNAKQDNTKEEEPSAHDILHYAIDNNDIDYLMQYQNLFPSSMISELQKAIGEKSVSIDSQEEVVIVNGPMDNHLTRESGVFDGPSGRETYYNLPMGGVVDIMRGCGYSEEDYPYWVRDDGAKMLGPYVMVAASFDIRPRGTILECSLGTALVCDTGGFAYSNPYQLDIAVDW